MKNIIIPMLISFSFLGGCSTLTQPDNQRISVTASFEGKAIQDADCSLKNDRGTWEVKSPGQIDVRKSSENLTVICKKTGFVDGLLTAISRATGSMFGNIIFGGGIGAIIDHSNGKAYEYSNTLPIQMGAAIVVDPREPQKVATK